MNAIYLDNNATTPILPAVWQAMRPFATEIHGNPASAHRAGRLARRALEDAREQIAGILAAHPDEVIFTSGATEANNLALFGLAGEPPGHIIASPIEHPSVEEPLRRLETAGFAVDRLPVDAIGVVRGDVLAELLRPETRLLSVILANNETGAVQPVQELAGVSPHPNPSPRGRGAVMPPSPSGRGVGGEGMTSQCHFHCDAVQAVGRLPVRFRDLGVTALTLSAHKFHGPRGIGALLLRRGTKLTPLLWGGHQQRGLRPGTEPVALVIGMAKALELWQMEREARLMHVARLRGKLLELLEREASPIVLNGPQQGGVPHTLNISFPGCRADSLLMNLDLAGVACSTGSACSSGSLLPSPVLQAMGVPEDVLHSAMRFSLSHLLTETEVEEAGRRIAEVVRRLRSVPKEPRTL